MGEGDGILAGGARALFGRIVSGRDFAGAEALISFFSTPTQLGGESSHSGFGRVAFSDRNDKEDYGPRQHRRRAPSG